MRGWPGSSCGRKNAAGTWRRATKHRRDSSPPTDADPSHRTDARPAARAEAQASRVEGCSRPARRVRRKRSLSAISAGVSTRGPARRDLPAPFRRRDDRVATLLNHTSRAHFGSEGTPNVGRDGGTLSHRAEDLSQEFPQPVSIRRGLRRAVPRPVSRRAESAGGARSPARVPTMLRIDGAPPAS
jgi:hypothetical protein